MTDSINSNLFQTFELSDEEILSGQTLSSTQKKVIQNEISALANQKILLKVDPANIHVFIQQEAEMQGRILALQWLITRSELAMTALQTIVSNQNDEELY